jgi:hypothetical protein
MRSRRTENAERRTASRFEKATSRLPRKAGISSSRVRRTFRPTPRESLQPEIHDWEPRNALVGEGIHEEIARLASTRLLVFEVGDGQADHVADAMASLGYADITITPDLAEEDRVVEGRR